MGCRSVVAVVAVTFAIFFTQFAQAMLLVHEPFIEATETYDGTIQVVDQGSGSGWSGNWLGWTQAMYKDDNAFSAMEVGTILTSGGGCGLSGGSDIYRLLDTTYVVGDGGGEYRTLWISFLMDVGVAHAGGYEYRLSVMNGTTQIISFGKEINAQWRFRDSDEYVDVMGPSANDNLFAVLKLAYDGTDTVITGYLAEDSDAGLDLTDITTATRIHSITNSGKTTFNRLDLFSHNTVVAVADEFRIGTTYDSVAPLAPSTGMLIVVQ